MMTRVDKIEQEVLVPAAIDRVWQAITVAEELAQWFGDIAELDLRQGGTAKFGGSEYGNTVSAVVGTADPPTRFAFRWAASPDTEVEDGPSTLVEFTLEAVTDGTMVRVVETGFAAFPDELYRQQFDANTSGWKAELQDLIDYAAAGGGG